MNTKKSSLDPTLEKYYSEGKEKDRLAACLLEKDRTLKILKRSMPLTPAIVLDIGGAAGAYAFPLADQGYEVHLIDPISLHIEQAQEYARSTSKQLASYTIGDARKIDKPDSFADVVLLFGPLYHLMEPEDRLKALSESFRVLKPGGILFTVAISRFASLMDGMNKGVIYSKLDVIEEDLISGKHWKIGVNDFTSPYLYLHQPVEFQEELVQAGFKEVVLKAIEGPIWQEALITDLRKDPIGWERLLCILETIEEEKSIIGASAHIMGIGKKIPHTNERLA